MLIYELQGYYMPQTYNKAEAAMEPGYNYPKQATNKPWKKGEIEDYLSKLRFNSKEEDDDDEVTFEELVSTDFKRMKWDTEDENASDSESFGDRRQRKIKKLRRRLYAIASEQHMDDNDKKVYRFIGSQYKCQFLIKCIVEAGDVNWLTYWYTYSNRFYEEFLWSSITIESFTIDDEEGLFRQIYI